MRSHIFFTVGVAAFGTAVVLAQAPAPSNLQAANDPRYAEVIAGLNLPMLIKLASVRSREPLEACVAHAQDAGRKYISVASWVLQGEK